MPGFLLVNPRSGDDSPTAEELVPRPRGAASRRTCSARARIRRRSRARAGRRRARASPAATARSARSRPSRSSATCRSSASRSGRATTSPATLGLDRDDPLGALAGVRRARSGASTSAGSGERVFLNNVSLGAYARLVHVREQHRRRASALARLRALVISLRHPHGLRTCGRRRAGLGARRARREQPLRARPALARRARAARRGALHALRRARLRARRARRSASPRSFRLDGGRAAPGRRRRRAGRARAAGRAPRRAARATRAASRQAEITSAMWKASSPGGARRARTSAARRRRRPAPARRRSRAPSSTG